MKVVLQKVKSFFNNSYLKDVFRFYLILVLTQVGYFIFRLLNEYYPVVDFAIIHEFYTYYDVTYFSWFSAFAIIDIVIAIILVFLVNLLIDVFSMLVSSWKKMLRKFK